MKILIVLKTSLKRKMRDMKSMAMMIVFPIVLIGIMGIGFEGIANNNIKIENTKIGIVESSNKEFQNVYIEFLNNVKKEKGFEKITYEKIPNEVTGEEKLKNTEIDLLVNISGKTVNITKRPDNSFSIIIAEQLTNSFLEKYSLIETVIQKDPSKLNSTLEGFSKEYVKMVSLSKTPQISMMQYFGITMLVFILLYGSFYGIYDIKHLKEIRGKRILISPISKAEVFLGEFLSSSILVILQGIVVCVFISVAYGVTLGNNLPMLLFVIAMESFLAVAMGMGFGSLFKSEAVASGVTQTLIMIMAFTGGTFFPPNAHSLIGKIANFSPVKYINEALTNITQNKGYGGVFETSIIALTFVLVFLTISSMKYRREDF